MTKGIYTACFMLVLVSILCAGTTMTYDLGTPIIEQNSEFSIVKLDATQTWGNPGDPELLWFGIKLLLPVGTEATEINIKRSNPITYKLGKPIQPLQRQYPLSHQILEPATAPNPEIYNTDLAFPATIYNGLRTEFLCGHPIAFTAVSPFEYNPVQNSLVFYRSISIDVTSAGTSRALEAAHLLKRDQFIMQRLQKSVDNHQNIPLYTSQRTVGYEYLMIIDGAKAANWQPLADYYQSRGISVLLKPVVDIIASSTGNDTQAKIRNFIIGFYASNPLRYVLLGGDTDVIPHRGFYVNLGTGSESDADIPADMYYSCLDGNWNYDNDNYWGEMPEADLAPEIAIGRICYNDDTEIANQINKITSYQITPVSTELKTALFVGEWLWEGPTWGGDYMDEMIGGSSSHGYTTVGVPTSWDISTLYDRTYGAEESWGPTQIRPLLSQGANLVNHLGHSNTTYNMRLSNNQVTSTSITNNGSSHNYSIYFSQGCYAGSFDNRNTSAGSYTTDSIAEKFTSISTAAAGMIAHSRYGWGTQGSTNGASQYFHRQYIDAIFGEGIHELGYTLVDSKIDNISYITNAPVMHWVSYETNLLGDPAMNIYTDVPQFITADLPGSWLVGLTQYNILTNAPNATVKLKQNNELIYEGITNATGVLLLSLTESLMPGTYQLFITAPNHYPFETTINVIASEMPYIICQNYTYDDADGLYHVNEVINISLVAKNVGLVNQSSAGTISLNSPSPNIQVLIGSVSFNAVTALDSLYLANAFQIRIVGSFVDHTSANLVFTAAYDTYSTQSFTRINLVAPILDMVAYHVTGPNPTTPHIMPSDQAQVSIVLRNVGSGTAFLPMLYLFPDSPYLSISAYEAELHPLAPQETWHNPGVFTVTVSEAAEIGSVHTIGYTISAENGPSLEGSFQIYIGMMNYTFEPDLQNWTTAQLNNQFTNQWHRSNQRNYTSGGGYSMKFGSSSTGQYAASAFGALISPEMQVTPSDKLRFYHYMNAENHESNPAYAWDGGMVQMSLNGGAWTQITPVGGYPHRIYNNPASPFPSNTYVYSGSFDWTEAVFELGNVSGSARFRFVFGSDGFVGGEGWYIDDVRLEDMPSSGEDLLATPLSFDLAQNYPNPFNPTTTITFSLPREQAVELVIFNTKGQKIRDLARGDYPTGQSSVTWDGKDNQGLSVASGMYFYRLTGENKVQTRKMLLMK